MSLVDKIRALRDAPADGDLVEFFGLRPGDRLYWSDSELTVGTDTLPMAEVLAVLRGRPIPQTPQPRRTVAIGDL